MLEKKRTLILCAHGSNNHLFHDDLNKFLKKIEDKVNLKVYKCFIEINSPSIEEIFEKLSKKYYKINFVPLLIFNGNHLMKDVNQNILLLQKKYRKLQIQNKKLLFINDEIQSNFVKIFQYKFKKKFNNKILVTISSSSKNQNVNKELDIYTKNISTELKIMDSFSVSYNHEDDLIKIFKKLKNKKRIELIIHPVLLFNGFLYNKIKEKFKNLKFRKVHFIKPILNYKVFIDLLIFRINKISD